jgi:hypothetical protein
LESCYRLPLEFDPECLAKELTFVGPDEWASHSVKIHYDEGWGGAALRSGTGRTDDLDPARGGLDAYRDTAILERCPYFREVLAAFRCRLARVRLLKLEVGTVVHEHVDEGMGRLGNQLRVHIPVVTNPDVEFYSDGKRVFMQPGECWFLDASFPHRLYNGGSEDRVHLVLDCVVDDWLLSLFPGDFRTPSLRRSLARKRRVVRFMLKDIARTARQRDFTEFKRRVKRLANELGLRSLRARLGAIRA